MINRYQSGKLLDRIPSAWAHTWRPGKPPKLEVWFVDEKEMRARHESREPFVVALAKAKDPDADSKTVEKFQGIFRVRPIGDPLQEGRYTGLLTEVLERLTVTYNAD
jgi:hypothetical protein